MFNFTTRSGNILAATLLGASLLALPVLAAETKATDAKATEVSQDKKPADAKSDKGMSEEDMRAADRSDARVRRMHDRLHITAAQEEKWSSVAKVMAENATTFRKNLGDRYQEPVTMTAVDDLKAFQIVADEHAAGLKKLIPAFETLYAALSPDQQKRADKMFSHGGRRDRRDRQRD